MTVEASARSEYFSYVGTPEAPVHPERPAEGTAESLVLAARNGNRLAWDEMVHRFTPLLWVVARGHRLSRDDAADVVQSTWLRCVERLDQVREPASVAAWLVTICRRESMVMLRRSARERCQDVRDPAEALAKLPDSGIMEVTDAIIEKEEQAILSEAISRLPDRPRQILFALLDGYERADNGYRGVAERLDIPVGSIGPTRLRALQRLRRDARLQGLRE